MRKIQPNHPQCERYIIAETRQFDVLTTSSRYRCSRLLTFSIVVGFTGRVKMRDTNKAVLRDLFLADYSNFDRQLTRRLGSADFASDVLQETYLRLEEMKDVGPVRSPKAYLFRIAVNLANDRRRAESRRLTADEVDILLDIPDERPDAARVIEGRSDIDLLRRAIAELPERRRYVLLLSRVEDLPHREIAKRLGVTVRTVETDLKQAVEHCALRLQRSGPTKFAFRRPGSSYVQRRAIRSETLATGRCGEALNRDETNQSCRSLESSDP
jgi:RNA polymerase sigma-70 factor (ECF subfamily)